MVDLRLARERAGLSQIDLAARLDISQRMVSRYETNVANAPFDVVVRRLSACGSDVATAIGEIANTANSERGLDAGRPFDVLDRGLQVIERYIETTHTKSLTDVTASTPNPEQLETLLRRWKRKPTVLLLGNIESRNSRLANFLLGTDLLPIPVHEDYKASDVYSAPGRKTKVASGTSVDIGFRF